MDIKRALFCLARKFLTVVSISFAFLLVACADSQGPSVNYDGHTPPIELVERINEENQAQLSEVSINKEAVTRGLLARADQLIVRGNSPVESEETIIWNTQDYAFLHESLSNEVSEPQPSVHPALWQQAAFNSIAGLFKVSDGIYQLRGFDLANMSIIETDKGWIVVDPLTTDETASEAFQFAQKHLGIKEVLAIFYTHSHIDHFGGVQGVIQHLSEGERNNLQIIAPAGFMEEATSENVIAGSAMGRRAMFMYGKRLHKSPRGHVDSGLGKEPAFGTFSIAEPTLLVKETGQSITIDGLQIVFQMVPNSEAPSEFTFYIPSKKAFCSAELVTQNLHNLYTLRGAAVRDALKWSEYIEEARLLFQDAEVLFASHHWPVWGQQSVQEFLIVHSDTYKYIHDQSVRMMNQGMLPEEIAESLRLPEALRQSLSNRDFYGSVQHNAKAVYQKYMGWYNGNPAMLNPLPLSESAPQIIAMMGGEAEVLRRAREQLDDLVDLDLEEGFKQLRWLAQLLNWVVFANPDNGDARALLAFIYDQLGYTSESAPWRDVYLSAALELRKGPPETGIKPRVMKNVLQHTDPARLFESMAVNIDATEAEGKDYRIAISFTDLNEAYILVLRNSVLRFKSIAYPAKHSQKEKLLSSVDALMELNHPFFVDMIVSDIDLKEAVFGDSLSVSGSHLDLIGFLLLFDKPAGNFNIVEP